MNTQKFTLGKNHMLANNVQNGSTKSAILKYTMGNITHNDSIKMYPHHSIHPLTTLSGASENMTKRLQHPDP